MAISTYQVFLMVKGGVSETYSKLVDIKDFGDLGGSPETLETTTLSDNMTTSIPGIQSLEALEFNCNYTKTDYEKLRTQSDTDLDSDSGTDYAVWFGAGDDNEPDGHNGKFSFKGKLSVHVTGGGVNEVVGMVATIAPSTPITFA